MIRFSQFDESEVEHFHGVAAAAVWLEPDVVGFKISVDDARLVCCFDRGANLFQNIDDPRDRKRAFLGNDFGQRATIEILHDGVSNWSIRSLRNAEICNVNNIRVSQPPRSLCLTPKPRHKLIVSRQLRLDHLDRHGPLRPEMRRPIHRPHPSLPEELLKLILVIEWIHASKLTEHSDARQRAPVHHRTMSVDC